MINLLQSIRGLVGFILLVFSVILSFQGFPAALLSWLGGGVVTVGYAVAISKITHEDTGNGKESPGTRFFVICLAFALASLGSALITWGGLVSIGVGGPVVIPFRETGILIGIACGLFNIDKTLVNPVQVRSSDED